MTPLRERMAAIRLGAIAALASLPLAGPAAPPDGADAKAVGFHIINVTPVDGARNVPATAAVQAHVSERFDPASVTGDAARLWRGRKRVDARVTGDLGGVVTISPEAPLAPDTEYRIEFTPALKSAAGSALARFEARFRTGNAAPADSRTLPPFRKTAIGEAGGMTALAFGPAHALWAATWEGRLLRWAIDPATGRPLGRPTIAWQPAKTRITGLCFDPQAARNGHLWLALDDNAGASVCELRFTARIVRLTLAPHDGGVLEVRECITGLPVGDHAVSGPTFGPDGRLYFFCGAITMLGSRKPGGRETPLSAAVLVADVRAPDFARDGPVDVRTEGPAPYDPSAPGAPVTVFATGIREAYDLCWHSNGQLYAGVNQNDTAERSPAHAARGLPAVEARADEPLVRIVQDTYYGHPNPSRDEWVLMGGNPTAGADPWEIDQLPVGTRPEARFDPSLFLKNLVPVGGQSADGCAEWRGAGFLRGRLLVCFYTSARTIHTFAFSADGTRIVADEPLCDATGAPLKFGGPLDLAVDDEHGRLYVADFADSRRKDSAREGILWLVEPAIGSPSP